jgi:hypothetical protein
LRHDHLSQPRLLTRDAFREGTLDRDGRRCVVCGTQGVKLDAHHIIERRLWTAPAEFGGYFLENGASVCEPCHMRAEQTLISPGELRERCGIGRVVLPEHLYDDREYTKWGDVVNPDGTRVRGELFFDESVQKVLAAGGVLDLYRPFIDYPRTYHAPWSNPSKDDRSAPDLARFEGQEVVVTEKMDGSNTNLYRDRVHGRSTDPLMGHPYAMVKALHAQIAYDIPEGWRICGENLYKTHSIHYRGLPSYFLVFSVWDERNVCLSWDATLEWAELLGLQTVPTLYRGVYDERLIRDLYPPKDPDHEMEGYVVRLAREFSFAEFRRSVIKFVRPGHNRLSHATRNAPFVPNELAS